MKNLKRIFKNPIVKNVIYPLMGLSSFMLLWFIFSQIVNLELILPTPKQSLNELFKLFSEDYFWQAIGNTLKRSIISFAFSLIIAVALSIVSYVFNFFELLINPIIVILRSIPTMSVILLILIWANNQTAPIIVASIVTLPLLYSGILTALKEIDQDVLEMSNFFKVPKRKQIFKFYIPYISPLGLTAIQSGLSFNVKLIIAAEVLASTAASMGRYMQASKIYLDTAELMGWTIAAIALSYCLEIIVYAVKRILIRWDK